MKQERYNIFKRPHKGLSTLVFDAGTRIQQTDFTNQPQTRLTINSIRQAIHAFNYHINKEDSIIYQAVASVAPYIAVLVDKANAIDLQLGQTIIDKLEKYNQFQHHYGNSAFGFEIQNCFFSFTTVVLQHINKEETVINELLWSNYDDNQLIELEAAIFNQLLPDEKEWYSDRILKWLTNQEITGWISGILQHGNNPEAEELVKNAKAALPLERWQIISQQFSMERA